MGARRTAGEAVVRFALFCAAMALVRWASVTDRSWREEYNSSLVMRWDGWAAWVGLLIAAGFVAGLACLSGRPRRYRLHVPLAITLPALLLLGHWVLVYQTMVGNRDLPWILDHTMFYMDGSVQFVLAVVSGFGIAAGLREQPREVEPVAPEPQPRS